MTYKNAVAGTSSWRRQSIIIGDNKTKDRERFSALTVALMKTWAANCITAEDVGTSTKDMDFVHMETGHVAG